MSDLIWAMIVGPLMWIPGLNIFVGALAMGWPGFFFGLFLTILMSSGGASNETVRQTARRGARRAKAWWDVLGVTPDASHDDVIKAYRDKAKQAHPDHGGSNDRMVEINRARDEALKRKTKT